MTTHSHTAKDGGTAIKGFFEFPSLAEFRQMIEDSNEDAERFHSLALNQWKIKIVRPEMVKKEFVEGGTVPFNKHFAAMSGKALTKAELAKLEAFKAGIKAVKADISDEELESLAMELLAKSE